jgi:antitoxin CptB
MIMTHAPLDPASLERVRWRCRRGLLELDIVLGRFIAQYANLEPRQQSVFDSLLDLPDTELWDMISGKQPALNEGQRGLLILINAA